MTGTPGDAADASSPLQSCRPRIGFRHSCSRSKAVVSDTMCRHISKGIFFVSPNDSSRAGTRVSKPDTWTAALWRRRRLRHPAWHGVPRHILQPCGYDSHKRFTIQHNDFINISFYFFCCYC